MPNKNYLKGRRKEYKICDIYKAKGYNIVQRTAGSHSPFDIIAIDLKKQLIKFIQCKPDSMSEKQKEKIEIQNSNLNKLFNCLFEVI